MESKVNYTLVGLFVLILLALAVIIILWLSTGIIPRNYKTYLVYMEESVAGLSKEAPVKFNGVDVGYIDDIKLNYDNPKEVILQIRVEQKVPINAQTRATLMQQGITGITFLGLRGGDHSPPLEAKPGEPYPVIQSAPSFLVRIDKLLENLSEGMTKLTVNVQSLMTKDNINAVRDSLQNIKKITGTIAINSQQLDSSIKDMQMVMRNAATASKQFPDVLQTIRSGANSLEAMSKKIAKTTGHADQLMPDVSSTVENMNEVTNNLRGLSRQLKQDPSVLIRGRGKLKLGPGE